MKKLVRPAAVAGTFYPAEPRQLGHMLDELLLPYTSFQNEGSVESAPALAYIVPHAGYIYSGSTAAAAYHRMAEQFSNPRIILFGPSHYHYFTGLAVPWVTHFETPLGQVALDTDLIKRLVDTEGLNYSDKAHQQEHALEVQLPFLQRVFSSFSLVPILLGDTAPAQVLTVMETVWGLKNTLVLVSSDLSHFHPYQEACDIDRNTSAAICHRKGNLVGEQACGYQGINALLQLAEKRDLQVKMLKLENSGDTAGDRNRVVGYGAYGVYGA